MTSCLRWNGTGLPALLALLAGCAPEAKDVVYSQKCEMVGAGQYTLTLSDGRTVSNPLGRCTYSALSTGRVRFPKDRALLQFVSQTVAGGESCSTDIKIGIVSPGPNGGPLTSVPWTFGWSFSAITDFLTADLPPGSAAIRVEQKDSVAGNCQMPQVQILTSEPGGGALTVTTDGPWGQVNQWITSTITFQDVPLSGGARLSIDVSSRTIVNKRALEDDSAGSASLGPECTSLLQKAMAAKPSAGYGLVCPSPTPDVTTDFINQSDICCNEREGLIAFAILYCQLAVCSPEMSESYQQCAASYLCSAQELCGGVAFGECTCATAGVFECADSAGACPQACPLDDASGGSGSGTGSPGGSSGTGSGMPGGGSGTGGTGTGLPGGSGSGGAGGSIPGSGGSGAGGAPAGSGGGGAPGTGGTGFEPGCGPVRATCQSCAEANCAAAVAQCRADGLCQTCIAADQCAAGCADYPLFTALVPCVCSACAAACTAECGGQ